MAPTAPKGHDKKLAFCALVATSSKLKAAATAYRDVGMMDSRATHHMATGPGNYQKADGGDTSSITTASGDTSPSVGKGEAKLVAQSPRDPTMMTLTEGYHVPGLDDNLMSERKFDKSNRGVRFAKEHCYVYEDAEVVAPAAVLAKANAVGEMKEDGQYKIGHSALGARASMASAAIQGKTSVWHRWYFHLGYDYLKKAAKMVNGLPVGEVVSEREAGALCRLCAETKLARDPFPASDSESEVMDDLHADITGPSETSLG